MIAVIICCNFWAIENKVSHCFQFFSIYLHGVKGPDIMNLVFWMLRFKPAFSLSSFILTKRLSTIRVVGFFTIRVVSSAYLRLLIFLPAILIPVCESSNLGFCMIWIWGGSLIQKAGRFKSQTQRDRGGWPWKDRGWGWSDVSASRGTWRITYSEPS